MARRDRERQGTEPCDDHEERIRAVEAETKAVAEAQRQLTEDLGRIVRQIERRIGTLGHQRLA